MNTLPQITIIATLAGEQRIISENGSLPWKISEDEKHFSSLIKNQIVIAGRKTFEADVRDLTPAKHRITLTRNIGFYRQGALPAYSLEDALQKASELGAEEAFVIGGKEMFDLFLSKATSLYLTVLNRDLSGDLSFPECSDFKIVSEEEKQAGRMLLTFTELERVKNTT